MLRIWINHDPKQAFADNVICTLDVYVLSGVCLKQMLSTQAVYRSTVSLLHYLHRILPSEKPSTEGSIHVSLLSYISQELCYVQLFDYFNVK